MSDLIASRYRLAERLGEGTAAVVWRAWDTVLDREVALKELRAHGSLPLDQLLAPARAAARLEHPNIVAVHDVVADGDRVLIAMELIEGITLEQFLTASGPQSPETVRAVMAQVARALACAHGAGVVHGSLKSRDIFWTRDGRAVVTDFATPGAGNTPEADVAAWGAVAYELGSGEPPSGPAVPDLRSIGDEAFARLIKSCLDPAPGGRPNDGGQLVRLLMEPVVGDEEPPPAPAVVAAAAPGSRSNSAPLVLAGAGLLAALVLALVLATRGSDGRATSAVTAPTVTMTPTTVPATATPSTTTTTEPPRRAFPTQPGGVGPGSYVAGDFRPPLAFQLNDGWAVDQPAPGDGHLLLIRQPPEPSHPWLLFIQVRRVFDYGPTAVIRSLPDDLANWVRLHPRLTVHQLASATVAGQSAVVIDAEVASPYQSPACVKACVLLFRLDTNHEIRLHEGDRMRLYVFSLGGLPVVIMVVAPSSSFDPMIASVENVIRSVRPA